MPGGCGAQPQCGPGLGFNNFDILVESTYCEAPARGQTRIVLFFFNFYFYVNFCKPIDSVE